LLTSSAVLAVLLIVIIGWRGGRYERSKPEATLAVARHAQEQEAIATRLGEETGSAAVDQLLTEGKGLASPTDRFTRTDVSKSSSKEALQEFSKLKPYAKSPGAMDDPQKTGPMIARTVSLSIIAKDFVSSRASLDAILARHNGYAADLNAATPQGAARSLQASLRIPAPQLPAALAELKSLGRVELETQNGEEVT
jgi:Domain of unknown function (DUF4349)